MRSWPIRGNAGFAGVVVLLATIVTGLVTVLAFVHAVMPMPDTFAVDTVAMPGASSAMADVAVPDTIMPAGESWSSLPDSNVGTTPGFGMGRIPKHIAYAYQPNVSGIVAYTAWWTVPERPAYDDYIKHTVFLWCGLQQGNLGLIQPVLEWDHDDTGKYWTIACWIVNKRDVTFEVSRRFMVYPGDRIRADLRYIDDPANASKKIWYVAITDQTQHSMAYLLDSRGAVSTNRNLTLFSGVLEGTDLVRYDADLPGDVAFEDIICKAEGGVDVPVNLTGYVDPGMTQVAVEYEDGPSGSPVIIHTHYKGQ